MSRRPPPSLERRPSQRKPKAKIVIFCEGRNTEPRYLEAFVRDHGASQLVEIDSSSGVPSTQIDAAINFRKQLRRNSDRYDREHTSVWCVIDRDTHPNWDASLQRARDNDIEIAQSTPCIELWAIYHYDAYNRPGCCADLQKHLKTLMPAYDHDRGAEFDYKAMAKDLDKAMRNAEAGRMARDAEGTSLGNPSTTFDLLLKVIQETRKLISAA
ncbi:MAG: RloB family protein [Alphaproteobacteria bacterium]